MSVREYDLQINDEEKLPDIIQALNASVRRKMMSLLSRSSYSIADLAKKLKLPISTVSFHVNILRKAGFVSVTVKRNSRGNAKIISRQIDRFSLGFLLDTQTKSKTFSVEIPLGSFCDAQIEAGCGMANTNSIIIADDTPSVFFSPERHSAQIIWFAKGYLEYRIPNYMMRDKKVNAVTFSMELCSEAPNYRNDWESDITFWVNGEEVATYLSPGDFGGRRGIKTIRITDECVYLDETAVSTQTISKLKLQEGDYITLRIGIKKDAHRQGGLNLFGEKFGDYAQGLVFTVDYN